MANPLTNTINAPNRIMNIEDIKVTIVRLFVASCVILLIYPARY